MKTSQDMQSNPIAVLSLVPPTDPVLRTPTREVTDIGVEVMPHFKAMRELMKAKGGVGLAAPQVGLGLRFFVSAIPGIPLAINPRVASTFGGRTSSREGCLTWPGRLTYVARHDGIIAEWTGRDGNVRTAPLAAFNARVFQHETDHLSGICIFP